MQEAEAQKQYGDPISPPHAAATVVTTVATSRTPMKQSLCNAKLNCGNCITYTHAAVNDSAQLNCGKWRPIELCSKVM